MGIEPMTFRSQVQHLIWTTPRLYYRQPPTIYLPLSTMTGGTTDMDFTSSMHTTWQITKEWHSLKPNREEIREVWAHSLDYLSIMDVKCQSLGCRDFSLNLVVEGALDGFSTWIFRDFKGFQIYCHQSGTEADLRATAQFIATTDVRSSGFSISWEEGQRRRNVLLTGL
jgi:hypothetical protein